MEITFKEACFDLTEGETKWRVWFYANGDVRVLKDGHVLGEFKNIVSENGETVKPNHSNSIWYILKSKEDEKTT